MKSGNWEQDTVFGFLWGRIQKHEISKVQQKTELVEKDLCFCMASGALEWNRELGVITVFTNKT